MECHVRGVVGGGSMSISRIIEVSRGGLVASGVDGLALGAGSGNNDVESVEGI